MDGSQKLPQRLFVPALVRLAAGGRAPRIALGVAAWLRFLQGHADDGTPLALDDPWADRLRAAAVQDPLSVFDMPDIVPPVPLPFRADVAEALTRLATHGVRETLLSMGGK